MTFAYRIRPTYFQMIILHLLESEREMYLGQTDCRDIRRNCLLGSPVGPGRSSEKIDKCKLTYFSSF